MKKLFALMIGACMVVGLAACNTAEAAEEPAPESVADVAIDVEDTDADEDDTAGEADGQADGEEEAAPAATGTVVVSHPFGETEVAVNPAKVVVGDLGVIDILDNVGIALGGVPTGANMPAYLSQYADDSAYVNIGSLKELDLEAINEYGPDLIILTGRLNSYYDECSAIAPTIYLGGSDDASYMEALEENIDILKLIFPDAADELEAKLQEIRDESAALAADAAESGLNALVVMANDGNISFFSTGSRYSVVFDDFGFAPIEASIEDSTHGAEGSFEFFAEADPDVIFVIDRSAAIGTEGDSGAQALLDNELVNGTTAAQNGRIIYLSSDVWYLATGGLTGTAQMIAEVATALG